MGALTSLSVRGQKKLKNKQGGSSVSPLLDLIFTLYLLFLLYLWGPFPCP